MSNGMPTMLSAFRTTVSSGGEKPSYQMVFKFASMADLHAADDEWHAYRAAISTIRQTSGGVEGPSHKRLAQIVEGCALEAVYGIEWCASPGVELRKDLRAVLAALSPAPIEAEKVEALREAVRAEVTGIHKAYGMYGYDSFHVAAATDAILALLAPTGNPGNSVDIHTFRERKFNG